VYGEMSAVEPMSTSTIGNRSRRLSRVLRTVGFALVLFAVVSAALVAVRTVSAAATPPSAPRAVTATPGNTQAIVHWSPPVTTNGAAIIGYVVTPYLGGLRQTAQLFNSAKTTESVTNLVNGKSYSFVVAARNSTGTGVPSSPTAPILVGTPTAPRSVTAIAAAHSASVAWIVPASANGATINGYVVNVYLGAALQFARSLSSIATRQVITGLTDGVGYTFRLAARNSYGVGPFSGATTKTIPSVGAATGVQFHCNWNSWSDTDRQTALSQMWSAGVRWVRIDVGWASIEPAKGAYDFALNDKCVSMASVRGFHVLETLWRTPDWANGGQGPFVAPANAADYGSIARVVAARYNGRHNVGQVDAWEVWNEPDSPSFWHGTTAQYVSLIKAAYPQFHAGNAGTQVIIGATTNNRSSYINSLYLSGLTGANFDVVSVHPYQLPADNPPDAPDPSPGVYDMPGDGYITHTPTLEQLLASHGDGSKPIWWTEFGWSTCSGSSPGQWNSCVTEQGQGDYLVRALKLVSTYAQVSNYFIYDARDDSTDVNDFSSNLGLLHHDLTPKPALAQVASALSG
jgi:hypothetical protein